ncbi:MAG: hypothetical protein QXQ18_02065 [Candidatus Aenigmatarchaeota archaeon]
MGLLDIFRKKEEDVIEYPEEQEPLEKINIRVENLTGTADIDRFVQYLKQGNILFVKTKQIQKQDLGAFQMSVQKLKRVCQSYGFDMAGTEEGYLVVTPRFATIVRP